MRFSASKAALLAKCRYPFRAELEERHMDSDEAKLGRALHRCGEVWVKASKTREYPDVVAIAREFGIEHELPRMLKVWRSMLAWLEGYAGGDITARAEQKIVVDVERRTAWLMNEGGVRDYGVLTSPYQFGMTIDLYFPEFHHGGEPIPTVYDWKTGHTAEGYWGQIGLNALGIAWAFGLREVVGGILHASETGVRMMERTFSALDIAAIADDTYDLLSRVPTEKPNPGAHCTELRCGALGICPETATALIQLQNLLPQNDTGPANDNEQLSLTIASPEHCVYILHRLKTIESMAKQLKAAVGEYVGDRELPVPEGILKQTYREVRRTNMTDLVALARAKGATDDEISACSYMNRESAGIRVVKG